RESQKLTQSDITRQNRIDLVNMGTVALLTSLLLAVIGRAMHQREHATSDLLRREAEVKAFADAVPDVAFMLDQDGRYIEIYGNTSLALLGRPREQLLGQPVSKFFSPAAATQFMTTLHRALATRETQSLSYPIRILGGLRHFDSRCAPVGDTNRVVWMIWDVTARRRAEQRLVHMTRLYDFLSQVNQAIVWSTQEADLLQHVCRAALEHGRFKKAWVSMCDWSDEAGADESGGAPGEGLMHCKVVHGLAREGRDDPVLEAFDGHSPLASPESPIDRTFHDG